MTNPRGKYRSNKIRKFYYDDKTRATDVLVTRSFVESLEPEEKHLRRRVVDACRKKGILDDVFG